MVVWSPDGNQLGIEIHQTPVRRYYYLLNADGSGEPVEVSSIPDS